MQAPTKVLVKVEKGTELHEKKKKNSVVARLEEKAMAPHSRTLAWKILWAEAPGGLQSTRPRRVGHD